MNRQEHSLTISGSECFRKNDIIIFQTDNYFNNIIVRTTRGTMTTRKMKWYEDADTLFLFIMIHWSLYFIVLAFIVWL